MGLRKAAVLKRRILDVKKEEAEKRESASEKNSELGGNYKRGVWS
jgi:hypothetical protein